MDYGDLAQAIEDYYEYGAVQARCPECGSVKTLEVDGVGVCDYCGSEVESPLLTVGMV